MVFEEKSIGVIEISFRHVFKANPFFYGKS